MLEFLPLKLRYKVLEFSIDDILEIRIRCNKNVVLCLSNKKVVLENTKLSSTDIENIIYFVCKNSLHSYDEQLKLGFVCADNGVRIGISGEFVYDNGKIISIKNYQSLCIRIPHVIKGVSNEFFEKVFKGGSVLVLSRSGVGKTTFIRDLTYNISNNFQKNVVVIDERNEIYKRNYDISVDLGDFVDVLTYSTKDFGFNQAIRTLNPDYIVTDELMTEIDVNSLISTINSGVNVIATVHANSLLTLKNRRYLFEIFNLKPFDYYVLISVKNGLRVYEYYDKDFLKVCLL